MILPVDDLLIRIVRVLRAERRIPDEALEHDRAERPPVALVAVPLLHEDFRRNVVRRAHGGVRLDENKLSALRPSPETDGCQTAHQFPTVSLPRRNLVLAGHRKVDGVNHDTIPHGLRRGCWRCHAVRRVEESLIVA